jgi:hypothetical protein
LLSFLGLQIPEIDIIHVIQKIHKNIFISSICPRMDAYAPEVKYFAGVEALSH